MSTNVKLPQRANAHDVDRTEESSEFFWRWGTFFGQVFCGDNH